MGERDPGPDSMIEAVFAEAAAMPSPAREDHLRRRCASHPQILRRVEALLRAHDRTSGFLPERPAHDPVVDAANTQEGGTGQRAGRYRFLEKIGEGGCGVVYLAEQTEPVRRQVAVKVIKTGMDTQSVIARFEAERQALAMMDHPNIARILDAGTTGADNAGSQIPAGRPYFVMELVRGSRITDYCEEHQLPVRDRLELFIKVCHAIQHAHQKGIIHRDIKPSNILVTRHDGVAVPKVIDFGIAKAVEGRLTDPAIQTQLHPFIGTPAYMSPEQAEWGGRDIDTRSDIYGLGVLLYELLTGQTPFDANELMVGGIEEMRRTIRETEPPRPSTRLTRELVATGASRRRSTHGMVVPTVEGVSDDARRRLRMKEQIAMLRGDLDWIVMKCLEKDRTRRYETANGLAADIRRHLNDEPVGACPPSAAYRLQKAFARHRALVATGTAILVALLGGTIVATRQAWRAGRAEVAALTHLAEADRARREAEAMSSFLQRLLQSPDPSLNGHEVTMAETLDRVIPLLETDLADLAEPRARLRRTLAGTYIGLGLYDRAIPLLEQVRDHFLRTRGLDDPEMLGTMSSLAACYSYAGRRSEALELREEILALSRRVCGTEHPATLAAWKDVGRSHADTHRRSEWNSSWAAIAALSRRVLGRDHPETRVAEYLEAAYSVNPGQDQALRLGREILERRLEEGGPRHPMTLWSMTDLAFSMWMAGRHQAALEMREQVAALSRQVLPPNHPDTLFAMHRLAQSYAHAGCLDEALQLREDTLAELLAAVGPTHKYTLWAMSDLADSCWDANRRDPALGLMEEVVRIRRQEDGPESLDTALAMHLLANRLVQMDRRTEACVLYEEACAVRRSAFSPDHPDLLWSMAALAECWADGGREAEALHFREAVLAGRRKSLPPDHPDVYAALSELGRSLEQTGRRAEACQNYERALEGLRRVLPPDHAFVLTTSNRLTACRRQLHPTAIHSPDPNTAPSRPGRHRLEPVHHDRRPGLPNVQ